MTGKILNGSTFDYYDPEAVRTGVTKEKTLLDTVSVCVSKIKKPKKGKNYIIQAKRTRLPNEAYCIRYFQ